MDWRTVVLCGKRYMTIGDVQYYLVFGRTVRIQTVNGNIIVLD